MGKYGQFAHDWYFTQMMQCKKNHFHILFSYKTGGQPKLDIYSWPILTKFLTNVLTSMAIYVCPVHMAHNAGNARGKQ